jgi:hypothetical protein
MTGSAYCAVFAMAADYAALIRPTSCELFRPAAAIRPGVEIVKRRGKDGRRDHVEDHDIDVRVCFDQSKHRHPLPGWCGFLFPSGEP